jgi:putative ABC transport system ATP-binding protein
LIGLEAAGLELAYRLPGGEAVVVLQGLDLVLPPGAAVGITGPSGSGKTSLLHLLAGIERPGRGRLRWGDTELTALGESARDGWRRRQVGLVFQDFHLLPGMSVLDNVLTSAFFDHWRTPARLRERARALLATVGAPQDGRAVASLSRGEQQRVALARALLRTPPILLADEPTASLDAEHGRAVADLLLDLRDKEGTTLIVVSHDPALLARLPAVYRLRDGGIAPARPVAA